MNANLLRVLLIEDNLGDIRLIREMLKEASGKQYDLKNVVRLSTAIEYLAEQHPDVILLDLGLPDSQGLNTLTSIIAATASVIPVVVLTSLNDESVGVEAVHLGAQDYLVKGQLTARHLCRVFDFAIERQQAAESLVASEVRYRRLFESAQDGILILDVETAKVTDVNPFLIDMLGYSKEEFIGKKLWDIGAFRNIEVTKLAFAKLQSEHYIRYDDMPLETKDGRFISVEFVSNVYDVDHTSVIQCNIRDITDRRRAEETLLQNQRQQLQIRDKFLSRMSHELRSPLTPIHQFVTILLDGIAGDLNAEQREYLTITLNNINMLRNMVRDLLEVTRAESGKLDIDLRCVYLTELIPQILKTYQLATTKGMLISAHVPADIPPIYADHNRVRQILDNLLDNAIKFSSEKGEISIGVEVSHESPEFIRIAVTDDGCGISPEEQGKIFNYLYQVEGSTEANHRGLGIGLYICRELVSNHGGQIWVESQLGHGSTLFFTLPIFSLERQLASVLTAADLTTNSITLITVEISHIEKRPFKRKTDQTALWEAWDALQTCALPNVAVLLPRMSHIGLKEFFFMVTCTNQSSADDLVVQLRKRLENCRGLQDAGLYPEISCTVPNIPVAKNGNLSKKLIRDVTGHIEDLMKTALNNGGGPYEWSKSSYSG
jgi:PAS domain S-box-containing protein